MNFGTVKTAFKPENLRQLCKDAPENAKKYCKQYFVKVDEPMGVLMWVPVENRCVHYKSEELKKTYLKAPEEKNQFNIQHWFFNTDTEYMKIAVEVNEPRTFSVDDQLYVNQFSGFLHPRDKIEFTERQKIGCQKMWDHYKYVLCSGNQEQFDYYQKWVSHMVSGRKLNTGIYQKADEGVGKTIQTGFLIHHVLGERICLMSDKPDTIMGAFNGELSGKIFLSLEEMPCISQGQWSTLTNAIKNYITGTSLLINEKHKTPFTVKNVLNTILNSNNNALKIHGTTRRWMIPTISEAKMGDVEYFNDLRSYCTRDVGHAFYLQCLEIAEATKDWNEMVIPDTDFKHNATVENLHSVHKFIKETYIKHGNGINCKFADLFDEYCQYAIANKYKDITNIEFRTQLIKADFEAKVNLKNRTKNVLYVICSHEQLLNTFRSKNWIHELDEIVDERIEIVMGKVKIYIPKSFLDVDDEICN